MRAENKLVSNLDETKDEKLLFRDQETDHILFSMANGVCTYVYGSVGIGKTESVKNAIREFNESRYKAVYVDCSTWKTEHAVLKDLLDEINETFDTKLVMELRSNADILKKLNAELRKIPELRIVALDHIEALQETEVVDDLLKMRFVVVLVSDEPNAINKLSPPSYGLFGNSIHFTDYTKEQVIEILKSKADRIFSLLSANRLEYTESLVRKVADVCNGNIGYGKSLLVGALLRAAEMKKRGADETDIPLIETNKQLTYDQRLAMDVLEESGALPGGQLYRKYCERTKFPKAERTFRNIMRSLCERGLVKAIGTNKGRVYEVIERGA